MSDESLFTGGGEGDRGSQGGSRGGGGGSGTWQWIRRFAKLWGFLGFCVLVVVLARETILPFVFALLLAYILAPVVRRLTAATHLPRWAGILLCYLALLAVIAAFLLALLPRLSKDVKRIGSEAPDLYQKLNDVWAPQLARWLEDKVPGLVDSPPPPVDTAPAAGSPLPEGTQFVITPLPDGRYAVEMRKNGLEVVPRHDGGYVVTPRAEASAPVTLEDRLRSWAQNALVAMQGQIGDVFRFGQAIITGVIKSVFTFFLVLMIAAFVLLDLEKIHNFARSLVPSRYRDDYDVIVAGIDRGLSGVIRGQLVICLVNGTLTYIGLLLFGVKYAIILAVVAALLSLIPIFGALLSTVPIVLAAMVSGKDGIDLVRPIFMVAWVSGIHFLEANLLNPKIIGSAAKIHPVLVIFALIAGEHSYGLVGALLAVPVASIVQVLFIFFRSKAWKSETSGPHIITGV
ncbi:MAG TPA: AI-2E family transporter [Kofleriaceae bacterium]|nr:AI-2E family transporter [Kofleriaceae bacterium]